MTNSELKNKIAEANDIEWFKNVQVTFDFNYSDFIQQVTGVSAIYEFVNQQIAGWEKLKDIVPKELLYNIEYFKSIKNRIIEFVNNNVKEDQYYLKNNWSNVVRQIKSTDQKPLSFNSPQTEFLIKVHKETPDYFIGAFNFLLNNNTNYNTNVNNRHILFGAIMAYEFTLKGKTGIANRIDTEQKSLAKLKSDFQIYLSESEKHIVEHLRRTNESYAEFITQLDRLKKEKENLFTEWFNTTKTEDWDKWYLEKKETIQKLESTYEAKLKLEKPAKYWHVKSTKYYKQGRSARNAIIAIVIAVASFLALILMLAPDWIFKNIFKDNTTAIVRWSIILIIFISLIAYTIKSLTKYMFSSFHLARDAEERHALTFFYLALAKDTKINDDDRKLILQSLFSRSDTGLLKEDSSPTMPSDAISKIISK